jgi:hypothetical protein
MFHGDASFEGSQILADIALFIGFLTAVLYFTQDQTIEIPLLDIVQTLLCWPSFLEGFLITFCLWSFRHIERMLGLSGFIAFIIYNFLAYLGPFFLVLTLKGFHARFPLLGFIPHSLFVFMIWRLPAVMFAEPLTDKFVISLSMLLVVTGRFPYSIFSLLAAIAGYSAWSHDVLWIRKLLSMHSSPISMSLRPIDTEDQVLGT